MGFASGFLITGEHMQIGGSPTIRIDSSGVFAGCNADTRCLTGKQGSGVRLRRTRGCAEALPESTSSEPASVPHDHTPLLLDFSVKQDC